MATAVTPPVWPRKTWRHTPATGSHTRAVASVEAEQSVRVSALNTRPPEAMDSVWPSSSCTTARAAGSQAHTVPSAVPAYTTRMRASPTTATTRHPKSAPPPRAASHPISNTDFADFPMPSPCGGSLQGWRECPENVEAAMGCEEDGSVAKSTSRETKGLVTCIGGWC
eukprot:CAMPEP_0114284036 /NCGR_PEP_ID=MMETSP0059-20121206/4435_1 /TAXON_ID=36894 /ORGANISM="Pyramimonas parkeae, Strain CCMP726" /LENGTH=167 /DNA_ID=CAMNT_0001404833 /DNA_START=966 /DNA_END=1469 /DNA_ORIENTATION=-